MPPFLKKNILCVHVFYFVCTLHEVLYLHNFIIEQAVVNSPKMK